MFGLNGTHLYLKTPTTLCSSPDEILVNIRPFALKQDKTGFLCPTHKWSQELLSLKTGRSRPSVVPKTNNSKTSHTFLSPQHEKTSAHKKESAAQNRFELSGHHWGVSVFCGRVILMLSGQVYCWVCWSRETSKSHTCIPRKSFILLCINVSNFFKFDQENHVMCQTKISERCSLTLKCQKFVSIFPAESLFFPCLKFCSSKDNIIVKPTCK